MQVPASSQDSLPGVPASVKPRWEKMDVPIAFRTNLLMPAMNAGVEIPVSKHSSIGADFYWPWVWPQWLSADNDRCIEVLAADIEYRIWPWGCAPGARKTNLTGLSFGIHVIGGYTDLEWDYEGYQGEAVAAGLDVTWAIPISRGRLRLELSAGAGYGYVQYREYKVYAPGGELTRPANLPVVRGWIPMPTRASVALVVPLRGKLDSKPERKGGGR